MHLVFEAVRVSFTSFTNRRRLNSNTHLNSEAENSVIRARQSLKLPNARAPEVILGIFCVGPQRILLEFSTRRGIVTLHEVINFRWLFPVFWPSAFLSFVIENCFVGAEAFHEKVISNALVVVPLVDVIRPQNFVLLRAIHILLRVFEVQTLPSDTTNYHQKNKRRAHFHFPDLSLSPSLPELRQFLSHVPLLFSPTHFKSGHETLSSRLLSCVSGEKEMFFFDFVGFREDKLDGGEVRRWRGGVGDLKNGSRGFWKIGKRFGGEVGGTLEFEDSGNVENRF
jgi:hypothetical protein